MTQKGQAFLLRNPNRRSINRILDVEFERRRRGVNEGSLLCRHCNPPDLERVHPKRENLPQKWRPRPCFLYSNRQFLWPPGVFISNYEYQGIPPMVG
ncbi:unnamed protein product [Linum trigynum]|uniref:Uncharacterized protein n=1 Tax=Linum trigynum TaxID=586398 RepID=A0AAV2D0M0_9ROSI